jgi:GDP-mannose 4,6 dehydratase
MASNAALPASHGAGGPFSREPNQPDRRFFLHHGDLTDASSLMHILQKVRPDEVYNLGAQSHVAVSFEEPEYTANCDALGAMRLLEGIRTLGLHEQTSLPSVHIRALRASVRNAAVRDHAVSCPQPLRRRQAVCVLDHRQLSRSIIARPLEPETVRSLSQHVNQVPAQSPPFDGVGDQLLGDDLDFD